MALLVHVRGVIAATVPLRRPFVQRQKESPKGHAGDDAIDDSTADAGPSGPTFDPTFASLPEIKESVLNGLFFGVFFFFLPEEGGLALPLF